MAATTTDAAWVTASTFLTTGYATYKPALLSASPSCRLTAPREEVLGAPACVTTTAPFCTRTATQRHPSQRRLEGTGVGGAEHQPQHFYLQSTLMTCLWFSTLAGPETTFNVRTRGGRFALPVSVRSSGAKRCLAACPIAAARLMRSSQPLSTCEDGRILAWQARETRGKQRFKRCATVCHAANSLADQTVRRVADGEKTINAVRRRMTHFRPRPSTSVEDIRRVATASS